MEVIAIWVGLCGNECFDSHGDRKLGLEFIGLKEAGIILYCFLG